MAGAATLAAGSQAALAVRRPVAAKELWFVAKAWFVAQLAGWARSARRAQAAGEPWSAQNLPVWVRFGWGEQELPTAPRGRS
jgi:hypothetical protein